MAAKNLHDHWKALASAFGLNSSSSEEEQAKKSTSGDTPSEAAEVEAESAESKVAESKVAESELTEPKDSEIDESRRDTDVVAEAIETKQQDASRETEIQAATDSPHHQTLVDFVAEDDEEEDEFEDAAVDVWGRLAGELGIEVTRPERLPHSSKKKAAEAHGRKDESTKSTRDVTAQRDVKKSPERPKVTGSSKPSTAQTASGESKPRRGFGASLFEDEIDEVADSATAPKEKERAAKEPSPRVASGEHQRELFADRPGESKSRQQSQELQETTEAAPNELPWRQAPKSSPEDILSELFSVEARALPDEEERSESDDATSEFAIEESEIEFIEIEHLFEDDDNEDAPRRTRKRHFKDIEAAPSGTRGRRQDFDDEVEPTTSKARVASRQESTAGAKREPVDTLSSSSADEATSSADEATEEAPERKRRRRRRRGKRGLEEGAEEGTRTAKSAGEEAKSTAATDERSEDAAREREPSGRSRRRDRKRSDRTSRTAEDQEVTAKSTNEDFDNDDFDSDDEADDRSERSGGRRKQRKFPTWEEAIGSIVDNNLSTRRNKQPQRSGPRRGNRGRGRPKS